MKRMLVILTVAICGLAAFAQKAAPPSESELAAITERGRFVAEYDRASWIATDAVLALKPPAGETTGYIARKTGEDWTVVFGRLNETRDKYLIVYEAKNPLSEKTVTVQKYDPPREDVGFYRFAAKALQTMLKDFQAEKRPYNVVVLPASPLQLYTYIMPAQTDNNVYPLGGDARYLIADDGSTIVTKRQLHKAILEMQVGKKMEMGFHSHVLSDTPEDTDVFYVLSRHPEAPELISSQLYTYMVLTDGTIKFLEQTEKLLKSNSDEKKD